MFPTSLESLALRLGEGGYEVGEKAKATTDHLDRATGGGYFLRPRSGLVKVVEALLPAIVKSDRVSRHLLIMADRNRAK